MWKLTLGYEFLFYFFQKNEFFLILKLYNFSIIYYSNIVIWVMKLSRVYIAYDNYDENFSSYQQTSYFHKIFISLFFRII
jgi:hypothetical protein